MQGKMANALKTRASRQVYTSTKQPILPGFETPFTQKLSPTNRWVVLAGNIPWDDLVKIYQKQLHNSHMGADGINPRVALGAIIIKHMLDLSDRETILQIQENPYLQYFIGLSSYSNEEVFDPSLFVEFRKRLGADQVNEINEAILKLRPGGLIGRDPEPAALPEETEGQTKSTEDQKGAASGDNSLPDQHGGTAEQDKSAEDEKTKDPPAPEHCKGKMIIDATACPQDISYPTDLDVLNEAREKSEDLIDVLYVPAKDKVKPRTYREEAHKIYLNTAQKKTKTKKEIRKAIKKQLGYLKRNLKHIDRLLAALKSIPLDRHQYKYLLVIRVVYGQQSGMYKDKTHQADHRIVSIHQPHVRPIVRGKTVAKTEFGAKIQVSLVNGFAFLEDLSWEAFNESTRLMDAVERYKKRFGYYPKELLADKIYCTRDNRKKLKLLGIALKAKPLGRPKAVEAHVSPGERNPIEGKFGQAKTAYGMNRIKARLEKTSQSWIASIIMVLNLVKLAGQVSIALCLMPLELLRVTIKKYMILFYIDYFKINEAA
jgi:hypothetical protein